MTPTAPLPPWPTTPPTHGPVVLREFGDDDVSLAVELAQDPYVPLVSSLPAAATADQARDWVHRQRRRHCEGIGFSFAIADAESDEALGAIGLWLQELPSGRARAGYSVAPSQRGHGVARYALTALTMFAWALEEVHRVELYIEAWNKASIRVAEASGYDREGLLRSHQEIGGVRRDMLLYAATRHTDQRGPG